MCVIYISYLFIYLCNFGALFVVVNQEIMEKTKMLSDAELMKIAIKDLNNASTSLEDRYRALLELLELVEPLDNANGNYISIHVLYLYYNVYSLGL